MTTIKFKQTINFDGKSYEGLDVGEPSLGAVEAFEKATKAGETETTAMILMLSHDTGMPPDALRKAKVSDLLKISEAMAPFLEALKPASGPTGEQSAQTS